MASVFTENNWQQLTPLPTPRAVTWALARQWPGQANAIYQVGGFRGTGTPTTAGYTADIERTPVNGDGTLGQPVVAGQIPHHHRRRHRGWRHQLVLLGKHPR